MDTFVDKLAQKRNAQEMILANMSAEAVKMEQMQDQMKVYDELMQEIRQVNLKTAENLMDVQNTLKEYMTKLESIQADNSKYEETKQALTQLKILLTDKSKDEATKQALVQLKVLLEDNSRDEEIKQTLAQLKSLLENNSRNDENMKALTQMQESLEEKFKQTDDFLHRENVKVYRNVQAAMTEELNRQTEELKKSQKENRGSDAVLPISILVLIGVVADLAIHLLAFAISL